jgi:hypothetical protein
MSQVRDPLGELALQRRLHRFFKAHGTWHFITHFAVARYLSDEFATQRARGATLLSLLPKLMTVRSADSPPNS